MSARSGREEGKSSNVLLDVVGREVGGDVVLELGVKERLSLGATALVADGVVDVDLWCVRERRRKMLAIDQDQTPGKGERGKGRERKNPPRRERCRP